MTTVKNRLLKLNFATFVLVNGMNLFPMFIFSHLFLGNERKIPYLMPLILYYSFKVNSLFLTRLKSIQMRKLLTFSVSMGILGCFIGALLPVHLFFGWLSGALIGICSGTLPASYTTVQHHERTFNQFGSKGKDQIFSLAFALIFSLILFKLVASSISGSLLFLGVNLLLLYFILRMYPTYSLDYTEDAPSYSVIETFFFFFVGFFVVFILKSEKNIGMAHLFPLLFTLFLSLLVLFIFYLKKANLERQFKPSETLQMVYKGMLSNFILVFCTLFQLLQHGLLALYTVYSLYLTAMIIAPILFKRFYQMNIYKKVIFYGFLFSFGLLITNMFFYVGVFTLSLTTSMYNQYLNQAVYHFEKLPQDLRLITKYRLGNIGSILHQLLMMSMIAMVAKYFHGITLSKIMNDYALKMQDHTVQKMMFSAKIGLILCFVTLLFIIRQQEKKGTNFNR